MNSKDINQIIESSPLRTGDIPVPEQRRVALAEIGKNISDTTSDPQAKLKVAILGEVKAGKSLLTNAIVGKELSRVDVLEATNSIIEIQYGNIRNSANTQKCSELYCESPNLRNLTLIDTPGLLTITEENAAVTEDFKAKADIFLWVFNAHHVGQSDVFDAVSRLGDLGKPIIGVINRVDELDASSDEIEELKEYFEQNIYEVNKPMFPASAKLAWDAAKNGADLPEDSGVPALLRYLDGLINEDEHRLKQKYVRDALKKQIALDRNEHQQAQIILRKNKDDAHRYRTRVEEYNRKVKSGIHSKVRILLEQTAQVIAEQSGDLAENAEAEINRRGKEFADEIADEWRKMVDVFLGVAAGEYSSEVNESQFEVNVNSKSNDNPISGFGGLETANLRMDSTVSGGKVGAIAGGVLAAGEVIAGASLVSAIATVFFPVAIVGAAAGFFAYQTRKNDKESISERVIEIKENLTNQLQNFLEENFEKTSDENCRQLLAAIDHHWPQDTIEKQISDIDKYLSAASVIPAEYDIDADERVALNKRRKRRRSEAESLLNSMSNDDDFEEETADV